MPVHAVSSSLMLAALHRAREQARARLPAEVWAWIDAAAPDTHDGWDRHRLHPHVLRDVAHVDTSVEVLGRRIPSPLLVAPVGYQTLIHPDGELATAQAMTSIGAPMIVSTRSTTRFERIAEVTPNWWLQVYLLRDQNLTEHVVRRAVACGAQALVLTGDTPYLGAQRPSGAPLRLRDAHRVNIDIEVPDADSTDQDATATLESIAWLRNLSGLPVLVKGVLRADDARACVSAGATGVIVSNHGRRQLARVVDTAAALPEVIAAIGEHSDVYVDGDLRDGAAITIALALGARAVLIGRPALWGLASGGADGVRTVLDALRADLAAVMGLVGATCRTELGPDLVTSR